MLGGCGGIGCGGRLWRIHIRWIVAVVSSGGGGENGVTVGIVVGIGVHVGVPRRAERGVPVPTGERRGD